MTAPVLMPSPGQTALPVEPAAVRDNLGGIVFALISVFGASLMSLGVRGVALELDSRMVVMARAGITSVLVIAALIVLPKLRRQLKFLQRSLDAPEQTRTHGQLRPGHVDAYRRRCLARRLATPFHQCPASFLQNPLTQRDNQTGFFRNGNKL